MDEDLEPIVEPVDAELVVDSEETEEEVAEVAESFPVHDAKEERLSRIWEMKARGLTVRAMARVLEVSPSTVSRDLRELGSRFREELASADPVTLVAESVQWLEAMERVALFEVHAAKPKKHVEKITDPVTGQVLREVAVDVQDPARERYFNHALKAREMKLKLLKNVGIIPTGSPDQLFRTLDDLENTGTGEEEEVDIERTPAEIQEAIAQLLKGGRTLT